MNDGRIRVENRENEYDIWVEFLFFYFSSYSSIMDSNTNSDSISGVWSWTLGWV